MQTLLAQHSKFNEHIASDFRIKSSKGVKDSPVRNKAMYNSQNGALLRMSSEHIPHEKATIAKKSVSPTMTIDESSCHSMLSVTSKNLIEISKIRKLEEARKKWEQHHSSNSPFRADKFSASPLTESHNSNSPFTISKVFGMRHGF